MGQRERVSPLLRKKAVMLATEMSYGRVAKVLQEFVSGHQSDGCLGRGSARWSGRAREAEVCRSDVFERGQTPPGTDSAHHFCTKDEFRQGFSLDTA
ncbi:MAG: hypothetical protein K6T83_11455, partial [Alicyclobacillus sp.]|nr:hypothetical protein [Alicyclobacillus sp.]